MLQVGPSKVERPTEKGDFWKDFVSGREAQFWNFMESECFFGTRNIHVAVMMLNGCIYIYILYNVL